MQDKDIMTYIYDTSEVYLTGRIANPQAGVVKSNLNQMVEIVPVGSDIDDTTYAKWVRLSDLLVITNLNEQEFTDET